MQPVVAVSGPGAPIPAQLADVAAEVGAGLASAGCTVVTGGLDGVMAAAARGARGAGGTVIGLLPGGDRSAAEPDLTAALATGLGELRNALLVQVADGLIAVGGSWGTLSEIALARRTGKPVVCLRGWEIRDEAGAPVPLRTATTPAEAVAWLRSALDPALDT